MKKLFLAFALTAASVAPVHAAVTAQSGNTVTTPTNQVGFEGASATNISGTAGHIEDGVSVKYISSSSDGDVWTTFYHPEGDKGWYLNGGDYGFTEISLVALAPIAQLDFLASTGFGNGSANLLYQVLFEGTVLSTGSFGPVLPQNFSGEAFGFTGTFDTVRLQATFENSFSPSNFEALAIDRIRVGAFDVGGAVPEPATWAMMLLAFGIVGGAMRSANRRQHQIRAYS